MSYGHLEPSVIRVISHDNTMTLSNGLRMPQLGFGTWLHKPHKVELVLVRVPLDVNLTKAEAGAALKKVIPSAVKAIMSKLWNSAPGHQPAEVEVDKELDKILAQFGVDHLDLCRVSFIVLLPSPRPAHDSDEIQLFSGPSHCLPATACSLQTPATPPHRSPRTPLLPSSIPGTRSESLRFPMATLQTLATGVVPVVNQVEARPLLKQQDFHRTLQGAGNTSGWVYCSPLGNNSASTPSIPFSLTFAVNDEYASLLLSLMRASVLAPMLANLPAACAQIQGPHTDIDHLVRKASIAQAEEHYFVDPPTVEPPVSLEDAPPAEAGSSSDPPAAASIYIGFPTLVTVPAPHSAQAPSGHGPLLQWPSSPADADIPSSAPTHWRNQALSIASSSSSSIPSTSSGLSSAAQSKPHSPSTREDNSSTDRSTWAMWVGNVPRDATYEELWRCFLRPDNPTSQGRRKRSRKGKSRWNGSNEATAPLLPNAHSASGIVSIFFIPYSNCAFVNYASESHLSAAIQRFDGASLRPDRQKCRPFVCRARQPDDGARGGAVRGQHATGFHAQWIKQKLTHEHGDSESRFCEHEGDVVITDSLLREFFPERYFVLKSHTLNDVNLSIATGLWATQKHNEDVLNQAFRTSKDVYLIFSVNKSGEFYGYARMAGPIGAGTYAHDPVPWYRKGPSPSSSSSALRPSDSETQSPHADNVLGALPESPSEDPPSELCWGSDFAVTWICTDSLPFTHARGLINPWNQNRPVKISRDGTELEPNVGRALLDLWRVSWNTDEEPVP
ncbi:hypothetical protein HMN09_01081000 [Mycena chlorophos]|uniref:YTH domain-containing protein n=1 Tax=Mycena chlorophos TaxID=658473 RepID=A0A8H6SC67_MYCCL|nr:hypothetical protein HMN09_01081000 [Mycena chlorophos]